MSAREVVRRSGCPALIVCPRCEGQRYDHQSCGVCQNLGYLTEQDGWPLAYSQAMQIVATFAIGLGLELGVKAAHPREAVPPASETER